ncbi:hypothetical protein RJ640_026718 [Escallonia rubra]|uniref:Retrovirus-related Pol polyprotein from transposon TNT 1-94-like beta-barrel domain-containing protein n=1 Tax=Escallonia rubra TaxID=112253 RepID=A0AA88R281_9ASTE|nr:hypothetical protein RJ640_026718 [Escallonia rubra]
MKDGPDGTNVPKEILEMDTHEAHLLSMDDRAKNIISCGLDINEYNRVSDCKIAREMWRLLEVTHEGTNHVKESKINMLVQRYEAFKMKENESINEMYSRFTLIIYGLKLLGKTNPEKEIVRKVLRSLPMRWEAKVNVIQEAKDLTVLKLEELVGSLMTREITMKIHDEEETTSKKKNLALKVEASHEPVESSDDSDSDMAFITCKFKKFLTNRRDGKSDKEMSEEDDVAQLCFIAKDDHSDEELKLVKIQNDHGGEFPESMRREFEMSMMEEPTVFLGLQIKQSKEGIFINQSKYRGELLKRFGMDNVKPRGTIISPSVNLIKDESGKDVDHLLYRDMIGSLLYLTASGPDIMFSTDIHVWYIVENGLSIPMKDGPDGTKVPKGILEMDTHEAHLFSMDDIAKNIISCGLDINEYNRVSDCKIAREMWRLLEVTHEALGKNKPRKGNCKELLKRWEVKVTAIQEAKNLNVQKLEELVGSSMTHEIKMKIHDEEDTTSKKNNIALKAEASHEHEENIDDSDPDIAFITRKFKKFLTNRRDGKVRKTLLTLDDSDESDKEMSEEDDVAQLCFIAKDDHADEVCLKAKVDPNKWIIDSGCSRRMTGDHSLFSCITPKDGGLVTFEENSNRRIISKGKIGKCSISIDNVSLVDGLKFNLINISQLIDSGHKVQLEGDHCLTCNASDRGTLVGKRDGNIYTLSFDALDFSREV